MKVQIVVLWFGDRPLKVGNLSAQSGREYKIQAPDAAALFQLCCSKRLAPLEQMSWWKPRNEAQVMYPTNALKSHSI